MKHFKFGLQFYIILIYDLRGVKIIKLTTKRRCMSNDQIVWVNKSKIVQIKKICVRKNQRMCNIPKHRKTTTNTLIVLEICKNNFIGQNTLQS